MRQKKNYSGRIFLTTELWQYQRLAERAAPFLKPAPAQISCLEGYTNPPGM